jgi:hypothetical protein
MLEAGEDYESIIRIPFKMIEIVDWRCFDNMVKKVASWRLFLFLFHPWTDLLQGIQYTLNYPEIEQDV